MTFPLHRYFIMLESVLNTTKLQSFRIKIFYKYCLNLMTFSAIKYNIVHKHKLMTENKNTKQQNINQTNA